VNKSPDVSSLGEQIPSKQQDINAGKHSAVLENPQQTAKIAVSLIISWPRNAQLGGSTSEELLKKIHISLNVDKPLLKRRNILFSIGNCRCFIALLNLFCCGTEWFHFKLLI
jgi:hypothetical protein